MNMWSTVLGINTCIWVVLGIFLVYSIGTLFLQGAWHQFLFAVVMFTLVNLSTFAIGINA